jgi:filamentous hemagglutinin family protein
MLAKYKYLLYLLASTIFIPVFNWHNNFVLAQITPDSTLGKESSQVNSVNSLSPQEKRIEGGAIRGQNLFHSFREFNVGETETVNFANPDGIANIFSRVTGNNISQILGDLGVSGDANLFLINPNGIIFGERASLNINGSFIATTASSIQFAGGNQFIANSTNEPPLLTVNVPIGLQFGNQPGKIINQAQSYQEAVSNGQINPDQVNSNKIPAGLKIKSNQTLALIGGEIILEGGNLTAVGGNIELGSVDANSLVNFQLTESGMEFDYSAIKNFLDITATNRQALLFNPLTRVFEKFPISSTLDVTSNKTTGTINLQGKNINITNGSQILTPTQGDIQGGILTINAKEQLTVSGSNLFFGVVVPSSILSSTIGKGNAGNITITTKRLIIRDLAKIDSSSTESNIDGVESFATGDAGNINIVASEFIAITNQGSINSSSVGEGKAGNINLTTGNLTIDNSSEITVNSEGLGDAGNIVIQAQSLKLDNNSAISAATIQSDGGNIDLQINDNLELRNQSNISAAVGGTGNSGNINITTQFLITSPQDNSDIIATAKSGRGGNINIESLGIFGISQQTKITQFSDINVSSELGVDGTIKLSNYDTKLKTRETESKIPLIKVPSNFIPNSCYATQQYQKNKYVQTGRGGISLDAKDSLITEHTWEDWRILEQESSQKVTAENPVSNETDSSPINPIQGWMVNQQGEVMLTANPVMVTPHPPEVASNVCY